MTPAQHYAAAEAAMQAAEDQYAKIRSIGIEDGMGVEEAASAFAVVQLMFAAAQVHATLATVPDA